MEAVSSDLGFRMEVIHNGRDLATNWHDYSDGSEVVARFAHIGHFRHDPKEFVLGVAVVENEDTNLAKMVIPISVDGVKNVYLRSSKVRAEDGHLFQQRVVVNKNTQGAAAIFYTKQPDNNIRLLVLNQDRPGEIALWEVAVTSQNNQFFVVAMKTRQLTCCRDGDVVVIPELREKGREWPQMTRFLEELFFLGTIQREGLPLSSDYKKAARPDLTGLAPNVGQVLWFSPMSGVGAIATQNGEAKAYFTNIGRRDGMAFLIPGELVKFDDLVVPFGRTEFKWEALGVEPHSV